MEVLESWWNQRYRNTRKSIMLIHTPDDRWHLEWEHGRHYRCVNCPNEEAGRAGVRWLLAMAPTKEWLRTDTIGKITG